MKRNPFLSGRSLWPMLKKIAKGASGRRLVAVPYVAEGASALLPLRKGDALLCALSLANAKNGVVCPQELRKLVKKGVHVYQRPHLHAKVFLLGRTAVVSSTNLSRHSVNDLDEAALVARDASTVASIRRWFVDRLTEPVTSDWLAKCAKAYQRPRGIAGPRRGSKRRSKRSIGRRVWMLGLEIAEFPEQEAAAREAGLQEAKRMMEHPRRDEIHEIRLTGHRRLRSLIRPGDTCIQVFDDEDGSWVLPAGRVLSIKHVRSRAGRRAVYVNLELPSRFRSKAWRTFRAQCLREGLRFEERGIGCRELMSQLLQDAALRFAPRGLRP